MRVLLATDAAGEGIDLQRHCHRLVNFDIPFNPSRLEQRIGRIDRYGQKHAPEIFHFVPGRASTTYAADLEFLGRIAEKVATIAARTSGSVNQVIAADDPGALRRRRTATRRKRAGAGRQPASSTERSRAGWTSTAG